MYFVGHTARACAAARFLFVSSAFVMKLNKMAYAGQGERLHVIRERVCVCVCVCVCECVCVCVCVSVCLCLCVCVWYVCHVHLG